MCACVWHVPLYCMCHSVRVNNVRLAYVFGIHVYVVHVLWYHSDLLTVFFSPVFLIVLNLKNHSNSVLSGELTEYLSGLSGYCSTHNMHYNILKYPGV